MQRRTRGDRECEPAGFASRRGGAHGAEARCVHRRQRAPGVLVQLPALRVRQRVAVGGNERFRGFGVVPPRERETAAHAFVHTASVRGKPTVIHGRKLLCRHRAAIAEVVGRRNSERIQCIGSGRLLFEYASRRGEIAAIGVGYGRQRAVTAGLWRPRIREAHILLGGGEKVSVTLL